MISLTGCLSCVLPKPIQIACEVNLWIISDKISNGFAYDHSANRRRWEHSLMCTSKRVLTRVASTWRWLARTWQSALAGLALWPLMIWARATTPTVTPGSTPPSHWSSLSSLQSASGSGGSDPRAPSLLHHPLLHWGCEIKLNCFSSFQC